MMKLKSLKNLSAICISIIAFTPQFANAVICSSPNASNLCPETTNQYSGGFSPGVGYGGFGGGSCSANNTPVVFIHGNADSASTWGVNPNLVSGYPLNSNSVYTTFKNSGYNDCELFGVTYLSPDQQANPQANYASPQQYAVINQFINQVYCRAFTWCIRNNWRIKLL